MAEEKAYLDLQEEDGRILISFAALGEIAAEAALAVSGRGRCFPRRQRPSSGR